MRADNLNGLESLIWACVYTRAMPTTLGGFTREECDRAIAAAELEADLHIERRRDREMTSGEAGSRGARAILEDIGFLPRRPVAPEVP